MWTHESLIDFLRNDSKVIIHAGVHLGCVGLNVHDDVAKRGCKLFLQLFCKMGAYQLSIAIEQVITTYKVSSLTQVFCPCSTGLISRDSQDPSFQDSKSFLQQFPCRIWFGEVVGLKPLAPRGCPSLRAICNGCLLQGQREHVSPVLVSFLVGKFGYLLKGSPKKIRTAQDILLVG